MRLHIHVCQNSNKHKNKPIKIFRTSTIQQLNLVYKMLALSVRILVLMLGAEVPASAYGYLASSVLLRYGIISILI